MTHEVKKTKAGYTATLEENESFVVEGEYPTGLCIHRDNDGVYLTYTGLADMQPVCQFKLPADPAALRALARAITRFADEPDPLSQGSSHGQP